MPKKVLRIISHLKAIPDWLKINNTITIPLPLKSAKELARKLLELDEDAEIELNFAAGKRTTIEIKYELKEENKKIEQ